MLVIRKKAFAKHGRNSIQAVSERDLAYVLIARRMLNRNQAC